MDTPQQNPEQKKTAAPKKGPSKLPSKSLSFGNQTNAKGGKNGKTSINSTRKGGVNLMRKLSGM